MTWQGSRSWKSSSSGSVSQLLKLLSPFRIQRLVQHGELLTRPGRIEPAGTANQKIEVRPQPKQDRGRNREHEDNAPEIPLDKVRMIPPVPGNRLLAGRAGSCLGGKNQAGNHRQGSNRD